MRKITFLSILLLLFILTLPSTLGCLEGSNFKPEPPALTPTAPSGTYVATVFGIEQTITFEGEILDFFDLLEGKRVFKYKISEDGSKITATNVVTGRTFIEKFKFIKEHQIVVIGEVEYHRR